MNATPTTLTLRRSTFDRVLSVLLLIAVIAATVVSIAVYVQRQNQPTVIYYCDAAACSHPAGEGTSGT